MKKNIVIDTISIGIGAIAPMIGFHKGRKGLVIGFIISTISGIIGGIVKGIMIKR